MNFKHQVLAITACLLWSSAMTFIKIGQKEMTPFLFSGIRFIIAGLMLAPFLTYRKETWTTILKHKKRILQVSFLQTIFLYGTMFIAMEYVRGAQASIIIGSAPIVNALAAHFLQKDDKLSLMKALIISIGIIGIVIISLATKPWDPGGLGEFLGLLLLLVGTVSSSLANVTVSNAKKSVPPMLLNSIQVFIGGIVLLSAGIVFEPIPALPSLSFWGCLFALSFISAAGFSIWFYLLGYVKVSKLNTWKFLIPVSGSVISWVFLQNESPDAPAIIGIILICVSIIFSQKKFD
jgi:drug/metabolite transporter (DMT)-like permease